MNELKNVKVVQDAYAAFTRGDIPGVLKQCANDIDWQVFGPPELPVGGQRKGTSEVQAFFRDVDATWDFERFEPRQFIAQGDDVVALGLYAGTAKGTGRPFKAEFAHVFTVRDGRVVRFREYTDTANLIQSAGVTPARV
jgi:uncharacterized protein